MNMLSRCQRSNWNRVAFIGTTKHAGKTTALNQFVRLASEAQKVVGLCSIGLDGERLDTILGVAKPAIFAPAGTLVISAERALEQSDARFEWLERLNIESPLGSVMLAKVILPGNVMLAGVRQRHHVEQLLPKLMAHGADYALVDGAFDRVAAASPGLVDAAVLVVGAVSGQTPQAVATHALPFIRRFLLTEVDAKDKQLFLPAYDQGQAAIITADTMRLLADRHALFGVLNQSVWNDDVRSVYLPGAVTDTVAAEFVKHRRPLAIIAAHPAQILLSGRAEQRLYQAGHRLFVWKTIPLVGIAVNPHSITGYDLPRDELSAAIGRIAPDIPVFDVMQEAGMQSG